MKLTAEQHEVVNCKENRIVTSCPGSGKTRTIISKILVCIEEVRNSSRKIGCLTYTNAATNEIESRLCQLETSEEQDLYEINTIHSFCLNNILRPYSHFIKEIPTNFSVAEIDSDWFRTTVLSILKKYNLQAWIAEGFSNISRNISGNGLKLPKEIPQAAAEEFLKTMDENGALTFGDIIYYSYRLLNENPFIATAVSSRFAWLLVDEFQDTTDVQVEILTLIYKAGRTKLFLVGDPNQSIYGFAGARPDLIDVVAGRVKAKMDVALSGNFRCSENIVKLSEKICPRKPPMIAVGENKDYLAKPVYFHVNNPQEAILGYFLPEVERLGIGLGNTAILAPQWPALFHLSRKLRDRGIAVMGPGARPYRRSLEFSQFAESAAAYVLCNDSDASVSAQRALFFMLLQLTGEPNWKVYSYYGKTCLCMLLNEASELSKTEGSAIGWLTRFSSAAAEKLYELEMIDYSSKLKLVQSAHAMIDSIKRTVPDFDNMSLEELGIFARPNECMRLMTMHGSKGLEFDAVAVIDFHDGKVPHFTAKDAGAINEAKRLTYVTATRAKKVLMFFSDKTDTRNPPSRFLGKDCLALN